MWINKTLLVHVQDFDERFYLLITFSMVLLHIGSSIHSELFNTFFHEMLSQPEKKFILYSSSYIGLKFKTQFKYLTNYYEWNEIGLAIEK